MTVTPAPPVAPEFPEHIGDVEPGWKCNSCEAVTETEPETPLYECGNDGTVFAGEEGNRCPDCNKFAARSEDGNACDECGEGACEEVEIRHCSRCGTYFEVGDEDDHEHDDEEDEEEEPAVDETGAPTGGSKRDRERRGAWAQPVLARKPITEVVKGDVIAEPRVPDSPGATQALTGEAEPFRYIDVGVEPRHLDDGRVRIGEYGVIHEYDANEVVNVATGWERPPSAVDIAARDLTLSNLVFDTDNWRQRRSIGEITWNLTDDTVTVLYGFSKRAGGNTETYPADHVLPAVDIRKPVRWGKIVWIITIDGRLPTAYVPGIGGKRNPDYAKVTEPIMEALTAAGFDVSPDSRKVHNALTGRARDDSNGYLRIVDKRRATAERAIAVLREQGQTVVSLSTEVD